MGKRKWIVAATGITAALALAAGGALAADDVIKIGACQPITGRFAFAGSQHQCRASGLHQLRQ